MRKIGFLGFGEVGSTFAVGLKGAGAEVRAYDKCWDMETVGQRIQRRSQEKGIALAHTPAALAGWAEILIAVTTPKVARETAEMVAASLRPGQFYADLNSATPTMKRQVEDVLRASGADLIDGGILGVPGQTGLKTPIALSGKRASELAQVLGGFGMQIQVVGELIGQASAYKVIRSIYTKGVEAVLLECLVAAEQFDLRPQVLETLYAFLRQKPEEMFNMVLTTHAIHARRRSGEMEGVLALLQESGIDSRMTEATMKKLAWSADLKLVDVFDGEVPARMEMVLQAIQAKLKGKSQ